MENERITWIDTAKGFLILCVIIGHKADFLGGLHRFIYSFHIPLFILLSGYTSSVPQDFNSYLVKARKSFIQLMLPFFSICVAEFFINIFILGNPYGDSFSNLLRRFIKGNGVVWFLVTLFYARLISSFFALKRIENIWIYLLLLCANLLFLYYFPQFRNCIQNFDLIFIFVFFLYLGFMYRLVVEEKIKKYEVLIGYLSFGLVVYFVINKLFFFDFGLRIYNNKLFSVLGMILGCLFAISFCKELDKVKIIRLPFGFIGRHTIMLLLIHELDAIYLKWDKICLRLFNTDSVMIMIFCRLCFNIFLLLIFTFFSRVFKSRIDFFLKQRKVIHDEGKEC